MKISCILVVKNGQKFIAEALESVKGVVDEIIVVDNGSIDKTKDVATKYTKKIFFDSDSSDARLSNLRNLAIRRATGDWILRLDADEVLSAEAARLIPSIVNNKIFDGYWLRRKNFITRNKYLKYGYFYPDYQLALFRRKKEYTFSGDVHSRVLIQKEKTKEIPVDILHYQQNPKFNSFASFRNLYDYILIDARGLEKKYNSLLMMFILGVYKFITMFINGYFRGKGALDGWDGFRATLLFSLYVAAGYFVGGWSKFKKLI